MQDVVGVDFLGMPGYAFCVRFQEGEVEALQCSVTILLCSPRSAYGLRERSVDRNDLLGLVLLFRAMLDGLVDVADDESEEGYATFEGLGIEVRQVRSADADVAFEVASSDCGCQDEAPFNHQGFVGISCERERFRMYVDALEAAVRQPRPLSRP